MGRFKSIIIALLLVGLLAGLLYAITSKDEPASHASNAPINPNWVPVYVDQEEGSPVDVTYSYSELVDMVSPAVVSIITEKIEYDIFRQPYPTGGAGTGIIIDPQGYIVTNNHVIEEAEIVTVIFSDGDSVEAEVWVGDSETDLAVVKIQGDDLPYAHFLEDSLDKLQIGDKVMAVGNAGGRGIASTEGTVSFLEEAVNIGDTVLYDLIRTSAAINPGNSGGPLVNLAGQVIGINVAINPEYENFGFAISTNTAINTIERLVKSGYIPPAWLGVVITNVDDVTSNFKSQYNITVDSGAVVVEVVSGSPAEEAGLVIGDVIIEFDGDEINTAQELVTAIRNNKPGETVEFTYLRDEETNTTEATLIQRP